MVDKQKVEPDHTAVRVALWRALHVQIDAQPHILTDEVGMKLVNEKGWRERPDMNPQFCRQMRAGMVGRARFIEDLLEEKMNQGISQYVILGAGLDTFAQRRPELASRLDVFEVDQPGPQAWKQKRLAEFGFAIPTWLHFVPVNFEAEQSWWEKLISAGFNTSKPTFIVSTGVSMYLTREANRALLQQSLKLVPGSTFAMTFILSPELLNPDERSTVEFVIKMAKEGGTPWLSLFAPPEILALAKEAGFKKTETVSGRDLFERYFANRQDGLRSGDAEAFLIAMT